MDWLLFIHLGKELCFVLTNMNTTYKEFYSSKNVEKFNVSYLDDKEKEILESLNYYLSVRDKLYVLYNYKDAISKTILDSLYKLKPRIYNTIDLNSFYLTEQICRSKNLHQSENTIN